MVMLVGPPCKWWGRASGGELFIKLIGFRTRLNVFQPLAPHCHICSGTIIFCSTIVKLNICLISMLIPLMSTNLDCARAAYDAEEFSSIRTAI